MPLKLLDWYIIKKFLGTYVFAIVLRKGGKYSLHI